MERGGYPIPNQILVRMERKKDMSKIKCFHYHELGHYATKCLHKKAGKKPSGRAAGESITSQFKLDFTLIVCMVSSMMDTMYYLDSGASFHMTNNKYIFSNLEQKDLQMHIKMGDDGRYIMTNIYPITFQREFASTLTLRDVMYVSGLEKNLVFVAMLEDRRYDMIFSQGKAFLHQIATRQVKKIEVLLKNLYKLEV